MYTYVGNNPINYVDPTGHNPVLIAVILIAALGLSGCSDSLNIEPPSDIRNYNCKAYAFGETKASNPGGINYTDSTPQEVYDILQEEYGDNIRQVDGIDAQLNENEYLVALNTGSRLVDNDDPSTFVIEKTPIWDYHFVVKNPNTGVWAHKPGQTPITTMNESDVSEPWDMGEPGHPQYIEDFYNRETVYFAVDEGVREYGFYD